MNVSVLPLILKGAKFPKLLGQSVSQFSAFVCEGGKPHPILFQVDDVNAQGRVASQAGSDLERDESPGVLDENDEVVFMLADLGDPCPETVLAKVVGQAEEIRVTAGYLQAPAVVYLVSGEKGFLPSGARVSYDAASDEVRAEGYRLSYTPERPFLFKEWAYHDLKGRENKNLHDRHKVRAHVKALGSLLSFTYTEKDFEAKLAGVRSGPLRVTRETNITFNAIPGLNVDSWGAFRHYPRFIHGSAPFRLPKSAALFASSIDAAFYNDYRDLKGIRIATGASSEGVLVDGQMAESEKTLRFSGGNWFMMTGLGINEVRVLSLEQGLKLTPGVYLVDDSTAADPPEDVPGSLPAYGYRLDGWAHLQAKTYQLDVYYALLPGFPEGGGSGFYKVLSETPVIVVKELSASSR